MRRSLGTLLRAGFYPAEAEELHGQLSNMVFALVAPELISGARRGRRARDAAFERGIELLHARPARPPWATMTAMPGRILWDVDTQVDFMEPSGKLYVPGRQRRHGRDGAARRRRPRRRIVHVASADDHELTDPEISELARLPEHVSAALPARHARRREDRRDEAARPAAARARPVPAGAPARLIEGRREILLLKKSFDVFTNPNTDPLLAALDPDEIVVFGVATDVCDDAAILGFLQRGRRVRFVEDAARGLDEARDGRLHGRLAGARRRVRDGREGGRVPRLRDSLPPADEVGG